jgi:hypothetical protein
MTERMFSLVKKIKESRIDIGSKVLHTIINCPLEEYVSLRSIFNDCDYRVATNNNHLFHDADYVFQDAIWRLPSDFSDTVINLRLSSSPFYWKTLFNMTDACKSGGQIIICYPTLSDIPASSNEDFYRIGRRIVPHLADYIGATTEYVFFDDESETGDLYTIFRKKPAIYE